MAGPRLNYRIAGLVSGVLGNGIPIKVSLNFPEIKKDLERLDKNLEEALLFELNRIGKEVQDEMVSRFNRTMVYRKPWRKTGAIVNSLKGWKIVRNATKGIENQWLKLGFIGSVITKHGLPLTLIILKLH